MIPPREQQLIRQRFEQELRGRVRLDYFTQKPSPIVVPGRIECKSCETVREAVEELAALHPKIALTVHEFADARDAAQRLGVERVPCIVVRGQANRAIRFYGMAGGAQFPNLIETIIVSTHTQVAADRDAIVRLRRLRDTVHASVYVTPACRYSPAVANVACRLALADASLRVDVVDVSEYPELAKRFAVRATPTVVFGGTFSVQGAVVDAPFAEYAQRSLERSPQLAPVDAGPATPFEPDAVTPARDAPAAGQRLYIPGR